MKRTPMKRWRPKAERRNSYARRDRFPDYMVFVKTLPCAASTIREHLCLGVIEADHAGARGMNRKCHDFEVIPLCKSAHDQRPGRGGAFALFDRDGMREWLLVAIRRTQETAVAWRAPNWCDLVAWLEENGRPITAPTPDVDPVPY